MKSMFATSITILFTTFSLANDKTLVAPDGTTVTIHRDEYGVPHIVGESEVGVFFGQGFAVAEDRLAQLEINRRGAEGRMSEILGSSYLSWDKFVRTMGYTKKERRRQFTSLPEGIQSMLEAYTAGINTFLDTMAVNPNDYKPWEFVLLDLNVEPWTVLNSVAVTQFMSRTFGQFGGQELERLDELQKNGKVWFDMNRPINDPSAPTTIMGGGVAFNNQWQYSGIHVRSDIIRKIRDQREEVRILGRKVGLPDKFGSFAVLVSPARSSSGNVMLLGCPQMGTPEKDETQITNEVELVCPSFHVGGMSVAGIPGVLIGHTEHHAWTMTSGMSDNTDVYIDSTKDTTYEQYYYSGQWLDFETITDTIKVWPSMREIFTHYRTIHGPVFGDDLENHQVFSAKMTTWDEELKMVQFFYNSYKATSFEQFEKAAKDFFIMNFNLHYADLEQNIKYWHLGKFQDRTDGVDPRLPHKGDGSEEWGGFINFTDLPQSDDPVQGYFVNWNNKPVGWWNNGDNVPWVGSHRVQLMTNYVDPISSFSFEHLKSVPKNISSHGTYQQAVELMGRLIVDENILPPGQSGFISMKGERSPHFDDQWALHMNWEFKDMQFGEDYVIIGKDIDLPQEFLLYQNYPNPFNTTTTFRFDLSYTVNVEIVIYDVLGREVDRPVNRRFASGKHEVLWDASSLPSGIYIYRLLVGQHNASSKEKIMKMVLLK